MAGSYKHVLDEEGNLVSNERFVQMIENLGDAYEMAVDMDGEIRRLRERVAKLEEALEQVAGIGPDTHKYPADGLMEARRRTRRALDKGEDDGE